MARHWFAVASSIFVSTLLATSAFAQIPYDPSTQDGRTSLRPGWSREGIDPAAARSRYVVSPAPVRQVQYTENSESGHSFLPNWFGFGGNKSGSQGNSGNSNQQRQSQNGQPQNKQNNGSGRPQGKQAADADSQSMPPDPATMQESPLPGLGGSPMPRKPGQTGTMQNKVQSSNTANSGAPRTAARPAAVSSTNGATSGATDSTTNSSTRNSPGRRTAPHVAPEDLRRELSGTFPAPATTGETTATKSKTGGDLSTGEAAAIVSDSPNAAPAPTTTNTNTAPSAGKSQPFLQPQATTPAENTTTLHSNNSFNDAQKSRSAYGASSTVHMPFNGAANTPAAAPPQAARGREAFGEALQVAGGGDPNVLASSQTPVLTADIRGPKQILVGRDAVYKVRLQNQSDVPAEGIIANVRIPAGADVMSTSATQGSVQPGQDGTTKGQLQWQIGRLDRHAGETLEIHLVPRESRPLELGVNWTVAPTGSRAIVEVQEAKLQLEIAGPSEVLFDKPQLFKLTLTNPGTGPAENVKLQLLPPGSGQEPVTSTVGDLAAGASQTVEVELTARDAGKLTVKAIASAEGGLSSDTAKEIFCRKPELEIDSRGPATKYAGTMATYFIRARNPGTAPTEDVTVRATLPEGAEFTSASEGQLYDAARHEVAWHIGTLAPGDDNYMELKCVLKSPGTNRVKISAATAKGELTADKTAETNVAAIADLKLEVVDPSGPVAVGSQAVYEIHIHNRGASAAKDINVVGLFSDGIEPEQAEGATYSVADGRVTFRPIEELAAGRETVLRIRTHAVQAGTHVFRAEVLCRDLEIKLAAEETTRFYADDAPGDSSPSKTQAASRSDAFGPTVK